jgi:hypothetical protein
MGLSCMKQTAITIALMFVAGCATREIGATGKLGEHAGAVAAFKKCIDIDPTGKVGDLARRCISEIENRDKP